MRSRARLHRWGGEAARVPKDVSPEKPRTSLCENSGFRQGTASQPAETLPWHIHSWLCAPTKSHSSNAGTGCSRRANDFLRCLFSRAVTSAAQKDTARLASCREHA
jgi:hypothetical protein